jgi:hypothetical protein
LLEYPPDSPSGRSLRLVQDSPSPVVFLQQSENFGVIERVAPTTDNSPEFRIRAKPFQHGVKLAELDTLQKVLRSICTSRGCSGSPAHDAPVKGDSIAAPRQ